MLENKLNQPSKFRKKTWVEINDDLLGRYNTNSQIKFKTSLLKSRLCDYSDADILIKGTIIFPNTTGGDAAANNANKNLIFKNFAQYTDCISEINNTQVDNAKNIDAVMPMYKLIEDSDNYLKTPGGLW